MTLWAHAYCGYPSYAALGRDWSRDDWDAFTVVSAVKGRDLKKGYAKLTTVTGTRVTVEAGKERMALLLFGTWAARRLGAIGLTKGVLVPVPSSDCTCLGQDQKGKRMAEAIASRAPGFEVGEWLCWAEAMQKSSQGGTRDKQQLLQNMRFASGRSASQIVLVDDVVTTGGHLRAAAEGLRSFGHVVEHALCVAHTVSSPPDRGMFDIEPWDLEADPFAGWL
jgi:phosphoribosylpyrophosphate synthetase